MIRFLFVLLSALFIASCNFMGHRVSGDGNITTRTHSISGYHGVDVSGAIDVVLTQDSAYGVRVETDDNLQEFVKVYEESGVLRIHTENNVNVNPTKSIRVHVSGPEFRYFGASGACSISGAQRITTTETADVDLSGASNIKLDIKAPRVTVGASGACTINLSGETKDLDIDGSGSTDINAFGLMAENTKVGLSGAGTAEVFASVKLDVDISGAANVHYKGNGNVTSETSGAATVKKVQ